MTKHQSIILNDLEQNLRNRISTAAQDFADRCDEADIPFSDVEASLAAMFTQSMLILMMKLANMSPQSCAQYVFECSKIVEKRIQADE